MTKLTKKQKVASEKFDKETIYPLDEAVKIIKDITSTNFDATVDVNVRLGVDPRKANQMVRGTVTLPHGTGMSMEVDMGCGVAGVTIVDQNSAPIIAFSNVPVLGDTGHCGNNFSGGFGADFAKDPGRDFRSE